MFCVLTILSYSLHSHILLDSTDDYHYNSDIVAVVAIAVVAVVFALFAVADLAIVFAADAVAVVADAFSCCCCCCMSSSLLLLNATRIRSTTHVSLQKGCSQ